MTSKNTIVKITAIILAFILLSISLSGCIKYSETEKMSPKNTNNFIKTYSKDFKEDFFKWSGIEYSSEITTSENSKLTVSFIQNFHDGISHLIIENISSDVRLLFIDCYIKGDYIYYNSSYTPSSQMEKTKIKKMFANDIVGYLDTSIDKDILYSIFKSDGKTLADFGVDIFAVKNEDKSRVFNVKYSDDYLKSKKESANDFLLHVFKNPSKTDFTNIKFSDCTAKYVFNKADIIQQAEVYTNLTIDSVPYVSNFKISNYSQSISFNADDYTEMLAPKS